MRDIILLLSLHNIAQYCYLLLYLVSFRLIKSSLVSVPRKVGVRISERIEGEVFDELFMAGLEELASQ